MRSTLRVLACLVVGQFLVSSCGKAAVPGSTAQRTSFFTEAPPRSDIVWSNGAWSWHPTSLAWNCWTNALASTNGLRGSYSNLFTTYAHGQPVGNWNPNFWLRRYRGWTASSVWNNVNTNLWPTNGVRSSRERVTYQSHGVLVTPEHVLTSGHVGFDTNTWLGFLDLNNQVVFRQIKDYFVSKYGGVGEKYQNNLTTNLPGGNSDYFIGLLDRPVPASIGFAKVPPTNWLAWFDAPFLNTGPATAAHPVPLWIVNCQHRTPMFQDLSYLQCYAGDRLFYFNSISLLPGKGHDYEAPGDSGAPRFLALDGELCLAQINRSYFYFVGGKGIAEPAYKYAAINAALRELSLRNRRKNIYTLTVKDLSKYPTFGRSEECPPQ